MDATVGDRRRVAKGFVMLFPATTCARTSEDQLKTVRRYAKDPAHWRKCAATARFEAELLSGEKKRLMLRIADGYEQLAERAEESN